MSRSHPVDLDEAVVLLLFEGLSKLDEAGVLDTHLSPEERNAFWKLEGALERIAPVLSPDYAELIERARRELRDDVGSDTGSAA